MDVYVVSNCWWRDGATVIGAGAELDDAKEIANRPDPDGASSWASWNEDSYRAGTLRRDALTASGEIHPSLYQEIVRVSLAGMVESGELPAVLAAQVRTEAMMRPVDYATEISDIGRQFGAP